MFSLVMSMFSCHRRVSSNTRINARRDWRHHLSKYWYSHALVSAGDTATFSLANQKQTCHCVNVDLAIKISSSIDASPKAARTVIHQRKLATVRTSSRFDLYSLNYTAIDRCATHCIFYSIYRKLMQLKWSEFYPRL